MIILHYLVRHHSWQRCGVEAETPLSIGSFGDDSLTSRAAHDDPPVDIQT